MPDLPAKALAQVSETFLPIGVKAPRPLQLRDETCQPQIEFFKNIY